MDIGICTFTDALACHPGLLGLRLRNLVEEMKFADEAALPGLRCYAAG